jgi:site-specific DNA-methyltransferase (adenine-specific)
MNWTDKIQVTCEDNMKLMSRYPDNYFDWAIIDPPYGIDVANDDRFGKKSSKKAATKTKDYTKKYWDLGVPTTGFWGELFRVSKNQIVWGVNYFADPRLCGGRIFWDKEVPEDYTKSKGELAYRSTGVGVDYIKVTWHGMIQHDMKNKEVRIHPTQKPVHLYKKLLKKYTSEGDKILDTHLGSGSIAIACHYMGFELTACEIDQEYYNDSYKRFKQQTAQLAIF